MRCPRALPGDCAYVGSAPRWTQVRRWRGNMEGVSAAISAPVLQPPLLKLFSRARCACCGMPTYKYRAPAGCPSAHRPSRVPLPAVFTRTQPQPLERGPRTQTRDKRKVSRLLAPAPDHQSSRGSVPLRGGVAPHRRRCSVSGRGEASADPAEQRERVKGRGSARGPALRRAVPTCCVKGHLPTCAERAAARRGGEQELATATVLGLQCGAPPPFGSSPAERRAVRKPSAVGRGWGVFMLLYRLPLSRVAVPDGLPCRRRAHALGPCRPLLGTRPMPPRTVARALSGVSEARDDVVRVRGGGRGAGAKPPSGSEILRPCVPSPPRRFG